MKSNEWEEGWSHVFLCSPNARSRTSLVGRAQWKINSVPIPGRLRAWLEGHLVIIVLLFLLFNVLTLLSGRRSLFPPPYGQMKIPSQDAHYCNSDY